MCYLYDHHNLLKMKLLNIKRDFYLDVYVGLINNMDHKRISGTEPSSVILSQTKSFKKLKSDAPKISNQD